MCAESKLNKQKADPIQKAANIIAFGMIGFFLIGLILVGGAAAYNNDNDWFILFKDGFLILAGAMTTIIGYYFGSRRTESVESDLRNAKEEKERAITDLTISENALIRLVGGNDSQNPAFQPMLSVEDPFMEGITPAIEEVPQ